VAASFAADSVVLATSRGYVIRYSWDEYGNEKGEHQYSSLISSLHILSSAQHQSATCRNP
jgi:hypothetical protein